METALLETAKNIQSIGLTGAMFIFVAALVLKKDFRKSIGKFLSGTNGHDSETLRQLAVMQDNHLPHLERAVERNTQELVKLNTHFEVLLEHERNEQESLREILNAVRR